jgi:hypothetical protein
MTKHEYAFDVKLAGVVRVRADSLENARSAMESALDCANLNVSFSDPLGRVEITEASVYVDDVCGPQLFEVDGKDVYEDEYDEEDEGEE